MDTAGRKQGVRMRIFVVAAVAVERNHRDAATICDLIATDATHFRAELARNTRTRARAGFHFLAQTGI